MLTRQYSSLYFQGKCIFHHFFHSAQGYFLLCGVASTHPATQEASSPSPPSSPSFFPQPPPHSPVVETINRAEFHGAVCLSFTQLSLSLRLSSSLP